MRRMIGEKVVSHPGEIAPSATRKFLSRTTNPSPQPIIVLIRGTRADNSREYTVFSQTDCNILRNYRKYGTDDYGGVLTAVYEYLGSALIQHDTVHGIALGKVIVNQN